MGVSDLPKAPGPRETLGAMWLYTLLRFGLFFGLVGVLLVARVPLIWAVAIAAVLSVPLSLVLLRGPRQKVADNLERRIEATRARSSDLDKKLGGGSDGA